MNDDIPILKKAAELYRLFHAYRRVMPKPDRNAIAERAEHALLECVEAILSAGYGNKSGKLIVLERASLKLNVFRFFLRLMKENSILDMKKYVVLQEMIDEI